MQLRNISFSASLCAALVSVGAPASVHAEGLIHMTRVLPNGSPDVDFGADGHLTDNVSVDSVDTCMDVVANSSGKLVIAGGTATTSAYFMIGRINADGTPDGTFSTDGYATASFSETSREGAFAVAEYGGKPIAAGRGVKDGAFVALVARWTSTGALDTSFSGDGKVAIEDAGWSLEITSMAVQQDGKIVIAGTGTNRSNFNDQRVFVARLNTNGSLDTSFDGNGKKLISFPGTTSSYANAVVVMGGEGIYPWIALAGGAISAGRHMFAVAYVRQDGVLETAFDGDGCRLIAFPTSSADGASSLAFDSQARVTVGGIATIGDDRRFAVARVKPTGALDPDFSTDGMTTFNMSSVIDFGEEALDDVYIGAGGRTTVVGYAFVALDDMRVAIARLNPNGSLDQNFSTDGKDTINDPLGLPYASAEAVHVVSGDKIVTCGSVRDAR